MLPQPTVLVVEDEDDVRELLRDALEGDLGVRVAGARDGAEGLRLARALRPSLIVTDLLMPVMDGVTFCHSLRAHAATRDIPVVALSALDPSHPRALPLRAEALAWVRKPFDLDELIEIVRRILGEAHDTGHDD